MRRWQVTFCLKMVEYVRIVEKVALAQAESGQNTGAATATRKADIMKMF